MTSFLIMQLYGPLSAWGEQAVGGVRRSATHPSKSAVLGLCAAAQGIRRDDEAAQDALAKSLKFATKMFATGSLMADFHTVQAPPASRKSRHLCTRRDELREPKLGTLISTREYRQDAFALAALWQGDGQSERLSGIADALAAPVFHLYLGRKSCPLGAPLNPIVVPAPSLEQAFDAYPESMLGDAIALSRLRTSEDATLYWESCDHSGMDPQSCDMRISRYDQPLSRRRWQFVRRQELVLFRHRSKS